MTNMNVVELGELICGTTLYRILHNTKTGKVAIVINRLLIGNVGPEAFLPDAQIVWTTEQTRQVIALLQQAIDAAEGDE